ncbi:RNase P/MRP p29 subunit [Punctularia strigosozonata HHB-11173 SS5]|uniref:RNase P/MRP p29 subunit n=1 Tax=Punctularia strigosozonata (strain HHB-11173) TaxID=741275 RepID=UPI0004417E8B|nr:RNase P/MRP p29 subunit [Punctularia strigosozonata HHB-11173 SS5]EIN10421.1 RNase P/MRP p29 subunit [Punctularia strigosozonata HHB-11173 SS5]
MLEDFYNPYLMPHSFWSTVEYLNERRVGSSVDPYKLKLRKGDGIKFNNATPFTPSYVQLGTSSTDQYANRVQGRHMFLANPVKASAAKQEREKRRNERRKANELKQRGVMGKREAREKGIWKLDPAQAKYALFLPLHHMWMAYMSELLSLNAPPEDPSTPHTAAAMPSSAGMHAKLVKADFHGSIMTVRQSRNSALIGLSGIVVHETENTFKIVTPKDQVKVLPKQHSIFAFAVPLYSTLGPSPSDPFAALANLGQTVQTTTVSDGPHIEFELHGNQFCYRASERAGRKFKHKETIEL